MQVYRTLERAEQEIEGPSVVMIGNFDGVHLGHQALLQTGRALSSARAAIIPMTFDPHPVRFFRPDSPAFELTTIEQRAALLDHHGADAVMVLPFGKEIASLSPREFVDQILHQTLKAERVIVGEDFRFGHKRAGNTEVLKELCAERNIAVTIHPPVEVGGQIISSTRVREKVWGGKMRDVPALLTRPYEIAGEVIHGDARGRELGYPTANIESENRVMPPDGIYTTTLTSERFGALPAITYIGKRPTYEEDGARNVETFVLDWSEEKPPLDLYGQRVQIAFHDFIRPDKAFDTDEALIEQMDRDVASARRWHKLEC